MLSEFRGNLPYLVWDMGYISKMMKGYEILDLQGLITGLHWNSLSPSVAVAETTKDF